MFDVHLHAVLITVKISLIMANLSLKSLKPLFKDSIRLYREMGYMIFNIHSVNRHNHSKEPKPVKSYLLTELIRLNKRHLIDV